MEWLYTFSKSTYQVGGELRGEPVPQAGTSKNRYNRISERILVLNIILRKLIHIIPSIIPIDFR